MAKGQHNGETSARRQALILKENDEAKRLENGNFAQGSSEPLAV